MSQHQSYATGAASLLAAGLRSHDRDRYLTTLFAPVEARSHLFALYEFNYEIARTREVVRELQLGRIRLEWWRENIAAIYEGTALRRHAVVEALAEAVRTRRLSRAHFDALIDAREFDLEDTPPADLAALLSYARATSVPLVLLALESLGAQAEAAAAAEGVGMAYALVGLLRAVPFHARRRRTFLPADLLEARGIELHHSLYELKWEIGLGEIAATVAALAREQLVAARVLRRKIPRVALPALLPGIVAGRTLRALERANHNLLSERLARPDGGVVAALALAALRGRF